MNREEILKMAQEAGFSVNTEFTEDAYGTSQLMLEKFAQLIAAHEKNKLTAAHETAMIKSCCPIEPRNEKTPKNKAN